MATNISNINSMFPNYYTNWTAVTLDKIWANMMNMSCVSSRNDCVPFSFHFQFDKWSFKSSRLEPADFFFAALSLFNLAQLEME